MINPDVKDPSIRYIVGTIEGKVPEGMNFSDESQKRIQELGLKNFYDIDSKDIEKTRKELEHHMWRLASNVKTKTFKYNEQDFKKAINFLEVFCLYCAQANFVREGAGHLLGTEIAYDKPIMKAVKELEDLSRLLETNVKKIGKKVLQQHVRRAEKLLNKVFVDRLTRTEQMATSESFTKAEKILKKLAS